MTEPARQLLDPPAPPPQPTSRPALVSATVDTPATVVTPPVRKVAPRAGHWKVWAWTFGVAVPLLAVLGVMQLYYSGLSHYPYRSRSKGWGYGIHALGIAEVDHARQAGRRSGRDVDVVARAGLPPRDRWDRGPNS